MCTSRYAYQAPSSMLRARRKDANVRPNRWLDKKSSRGMIFENEELRLRTIEINAEVERGQGDIKKLKRQNEQLRREIWCLREEYDKLEEKYKRMESEREDEDYSDEEDQDNDEYDDEYNDEERLKIEEVKEKPKDECNPEDADNMQNLIASAKLLGMREQGAGCEAEEIKSSPIQTPMATLQAEPRSRPDLLVTSSSNLLPPQDESIRRRTFAGEPTAKLTNSSDVTARLSLPVTTSSANIIDTTIQPAIIGGVGGGIIMSAHSQQQPSPIPLTWNPNQPPSWGFHERTTHSQYGRTNRPPPPPPPPRTSCEQVTTVRRASSVLPDGTTRRSVTFQADSIIYTPPPPPPPPNNGNSLQVHYSQQEDNRDETTLIIRGLERVPGIGVRELIDAIEHKLGLNDLGRCVKSVCFHHQNIAATVTIRPREMAIKLLSTGLTARGENLEIEEQSLEVANRLTNDPSHVLLVSGVAHEVSDLAVKNAITRACGLNVTQVRRHIYKGVDTGERLVMLTPGSFPPLLQMPQAASNSDTESESTYRTHLSVQLRKPGNENNNNDTPPPSPSPQSQPTPSAPAVITASPESPVNASQCNGTPPFPQCNPSTPQENIRNSREKIQRQDTQVSQASNTSKKVSSQNGAIPRADGVRRRGKSRSSSEEPGRSGHRRRHGVTERPDSEELQHMQLLETPIPKGPALPWCACWGNGCI